MKAAARLLLAFSLLTSLTVNAAQVAQARLYCLAVKVLPGSDEYGDRLTLTSTGAMDAGANELIALPAPPELQLPGIESYASSLFMYDPYYGDTLGGQINIGLEVVDNDGDRFPDFFDTSKAIDAIRLYGLMDIYGLGGGQTSVKKVTWQRAAGSSTGTCVIMVDDLYWGTFHHTFQIQEYKGTLTYTPGADTVSGTLSVTQTGSPANTLQANLQFVKTPGNKYNELTLQPGLTTGALLSTVRSFTNHVFTRDTAWPTNYAGYFEFNDGDFWSYEPYSMWVLSITDLNDSNGNGIPDFSDDGAQPPPRAAQLSLAGPSGGNVQLTIRGDVGRQYEIQDTMSLGVSWQSVQTVTLSTDPQTITLPLPSSTKFWRVVGH